MCGGVKIPFHINFEEINLRFYVRCNHTGEWKRGVVFIKEIVPKPALAFVANTIYYENYKVMPCKHNWQHNGDELNVEYQWKKEKWHTLKITTEKTSVSIMKGSIEEFITEHYWGYIKVSNFKTSEYGVEHPRWLVYKTKNYQIDVDFGQLYGGEFAFLAGTIPQSVFMAEGSEIVVKKGITI